MNAPGMLSDSERKAILRFVRTLRNLAREDKLANRLDSRRARLMEAWKYRRMEREYRPETLRALFRSMLHSQLQESVHLMDAAE